MLPCTWSDKTQACYERLIEPLRAVACEHGYALAVHGSLARDIDLVAIPWIEAASDAATLVNAIRAKAEEIIGVAFMTDMEAERDWFRAGCPGFKPHGRLVWSFHLGGGPYIDLSVMPRAETKEAIFERIQANPETRLALVETGRHLNETHP